MVGKKINQLHKVISNRKVNLSARRLLLLSVIRPSIEYESEVWEGNRSQASSLESLILDGAKRILGCSSKTCNEAVRGDMGLDTLQSRRDRAKLKWWYKLATLAEDRYPKQLFNQEWNIKPRRGRQRKVWSRMVQGRIQGGGYGGSSPPPSRKWAGLQCAHAQRHVITIGLYTLNRCFWRVFRAATDQGRI